MKNYIKIVLFFLIAFTTISCACNRTEEDSTPPLKYELTEKVTLTNPADSTMFTLLDGCVVYVYEDDELCGVDNSIMYELLRLDMLDDNENYVEVIVRMGKINDSTEVVGFTNVGTLKKQKRLR